MTSEWKTLRGKEFDDGIVRYYNPHEHRWMTQEELDQHNKDVENGEVIYWVGVVIVVILFTISLIVSV